MPADLLSVTFADVYVCVCIYVLCTYVYTYGMFPQPGVHVGAYRGKEAGRGASSADTEQSCAQALF